MPAITAKASQHLQKPEVSVARLGPDLIRIVKTRPQHHDITVNEAEAKVIAEGLINIIAGTTDEAGA